MLSKYQLFDINHKFLIDPFVSKKITSKDDLTPEYLDDVIFILIITKFEIAIESTNSIGGEFYNFSPN